MKIVLLIVGLVILVASVSGVINKNTRVYGIIGVLLSFMLLIWGFSIVIVPSGYVGIKTSYGQISGEVLPSGQYFSLPIIYHVDKINCKQQKKKKKNKIWGESSERTPVYAENIRISFQINSEKAAWIWSNIEEWDYKLLKGSIISTAIKRAAVELPND